MVTGDNLNATENNPDQTQFLGENSPKWRPCWSSVQGVGCALEYAKDIFWILRMKHVGVLENTAAIFTLIPTIAVT